MNKAEAEFVFQGINPDDIPAGTPRIGRPAPPPAAESAAELAPIELPAILDTAPAPAPAAADAGVAPSAAAPADVVPSPPIIVDGRPLLDLRGQSAPMALLALRRTLIGQKPGDEATVLWNAEDAAEDLAAAARVAGLAVSAGELPASFRIRKK